MTDKIFTDREWLCRGLVRAHDKKLYVRLTEGTNVSLLAHNRRTKNLGAGRIYSIPTSEDGESFKIGEARYLRMLEDAPEREAIVAASRAVEASVETDRRAAKMEKEDRSLSKTLGPLRAEYAKLRGTKEKVAFELLVLHALRGY